MKKTRDEFIIELYEKERQRLLELSRDNFLDKPRKGCEAEWQDCKDNLEILEQMILEISMDYIIDGKEIGSIKQEFIGYLEDKPKVYYNSDDHEKRYFYIDMIIKGCGDEDIYKRTELLRLSHKVWFDWFFYNFKYEEEKKRRIAKNLCTYVKAIVIDGEVRELKWYRRYNTKK